MTDKEYEQKKRECWEYVSKTILTIGGSKEKRAFDFAFDCAYALGKQEKDAEDIVISGWLARDKDGCLTLFVGRERPYKKIGCNFWCVDYDRPLECLPITLFPDLTWESDPIEVEIIIKRKKK